MAKSSTKKRKVVVESNGEAHIVASFNNIIISLTNKNGDVISWSSAGKMGFRGTKKNTPYAAQMAAEDAVKVVGSSVKIKKAINACKKYDAVILDKTKKSNVIQITALRREIDKMAKNLRKFGLVSVSRTGAVAMTRGDKVFN